jgi:multidrug efflux pump
MFVILDEFGKRHDPKLYSEAIAQVLRRRLHAEVTEADCAVFGPPPVQGLGTAGGFKIMIEDRGDNGLRTLQGQVENLIAKGRQTPGLTGLFTVFRADSPQLYVDIDRDQCFRLHVPYRAVTDTLQVYLGSLYVNDINLFGRTWQVIAQAEGPFRNDVEDVGRLRVRGAGGDTVPLGTLADVRETNGPLVVGRYNLYPAASVNGNTAPGVSSGDAIALMERLADRELLPSMAYEWTEISYMQLDAEKNVWNRLIFPLSVVAVFLVLAAQYESWSLPLAVILVVPMCILGSLTGVMVTHGDINIFTQVGFVVLVGLASKNAILIVEFAKDKHEAGMPLTEAVVEACRLRLRPILMTSFAFILGAVPLLVSAGAGAEMRRTLGTAVFSGMLGVTLFGIFLTPVFFYVIEWLGETRLFGSASGRPLFIALTAALAGLVLVGVGQLAAGLRGAAAGLAVWALLMALRFRHRILRAVRPANPR